MRILHTFARLTHQRCYVASHKLLSLGNAIQASHYPHLLTTVTTWRIIKSLFYTFIVENKFVPLRNQDHSIVYVSMGYIQYAT